MLNTLRRWRTWIVNTAAAVILFLPDILSALVGSGLDWATIVPAKYLPYATIAIILINIAMRPRAAVLPDDPEVEIKRVIKREKQ